MLAGGLVEKGKRRGPSALLRRHNRWGGGYWDQNVDEFDDKKANIITRKHMESITLCGGGKSSERVTQPTSKIHYGGVPGILTRAKRLRGGQVMLNSDWRGSLGRTPTKRIYIFL